MRSLNRRFEEFKQTNTNLSDYMNLAKAVRGQNFTRNIISRWFHKLISKDEYGKKDDIDLITHLAKLTKLPEDDSF